MLSIFFLNEQNLLKRDTCTIRTDVQMSRAFALTFHFIFGGTNFLFY